MKKGTVISIVLLLMVISLAVPVLISCTDGIPAYAVHFDYQNGNTAVQKTELRNSMLIEPITPSLEGYSFGGWYTNSYFTPESRWDFDSDTVCSDMTLYAKWEFTGLSDAFEESSFLVGSIGPAGGHIFYDKGSYSNGWRFLEAAPKKYEFRKVWGGYGIQVQTGIEIGAGKSNTEEIVITFGHAEPYDMKTDYAAKVCADLVVLKDGVLYSDWFLPSKDELNQMYENLKEHNVGDFSGDWHWSSSQFTMGFPNDHVKYAWFHLFGNGTRGFGGRYKDYWVRPVRAF